jgi:hypothetical protein
MSLTFTAIVTNVTGTSPIPAGSVQFKLDGGNFGTAVPIDANGHAVSQSISFLSGASVFHRTLRGETSRQEEDKGPRAELSRKHTKRHEVRD